MRGRWLTALALAALALAACGEDEREQGGVAREDVSIAFVGHGPAGDHFWRVVRKGARTARDDLGVKLDDRVAAQFDVPRMRRLIDAAIEDEPDGLAVSVPDPEALRPVLEKAVRAGIPVVTLNSGESTSRRVGALAHVGQPERRAGAEAGRRMKAAGVTRALCVNHEVGNTELDARCAGLREGLDGAAEVLAVDLTDPNDARQRIAQVVKDRPEVDGVLAVGPPSADPALEALRGNRRVRLAAMDLSDTVLEGVRRGDLLFATDQQQYLQGYLPVQILALNAQLGVRPGPVVDTGPAFVTKENAERVARLRREGLR